MSAATHVYEIFIRAPQQQVWDALIKPEYTTRYFHGTRFESSFEPGARFVNRIVAADRPAADGVIEVFDPPSRLVYTWHVLYDVEMSEEPPGRVEWRLAPANDEYAPTPGYPTGPHPPIWGGEPPSSLCPRQDSNLRHPL